MSKSLKVRLGTTLFLICTLMNCSTLANYSRQPLNKRHLRISLDAPKTEYRWHEETCLKRVLGVCIQTGVIYHVDEDFDFTKAEDRKKFLDMGFDCSVRERP